MFEIILKVFGIVLGIAILLVGLMWVSSTFSKQADDARADAVLSQSSQIRGALKARYSETSSYPAAVDDLVSEGYLKANPGGGNWTIENGMIVRPLGTTPGDEALCMSIARRAGQSLSSAADIPLCTAAGASDYCCKVPD